MQEIVVIDGEISLENTLDGEVELEAITDLDPDVVMSAGGGITPSGTIEITENGVYDVTEYASADVDVQGGITPTGTKTITEPGTYDVTNYATVEVEIDMWTEQTISTDGAVTQALNPYVMYHFIGALTALTITLATPSQGQIPHYHFDFDSGSTAPTLTLPNTVTMPDSFEVEASKRYEIDILNNYGTVAEWA